MNARDKRIQKHNRLQALAREIKEHCDLQLGAWRTSLEHARQVGLKLIEAKGLMAHGDWIPWLLKHCDVKPGTARNYKAIAEAWDDPEFEAARNSPDFTYTINGAIAAITKINRHAKLDKLPETNREQLLGFLSETLINKVNKMPDEQVATLAKSFPQDAWADFLQTAELVSLGATPSAEIISQFQSKFMWDDDLAADFNRALDAWRRKFGDSGNESNNPATTDELLTFIQTNFERLWQQYMRNVVKLLMEGPPMQLQTVA